MQRPDNPIDAPTNTDEQRIVPQDLDGTLDFLAYSDVLDAEEGLREDGGLEGELNEGIERREGDDPGGVDGTDLPGAGFGNCREVVVGDAGNLRERSACERRTILDERETART